MTIWIHGSGAGAHALAWKFAESRLCSEIICTPGNAGTANVLLVNFFFGDMNIVHR